MSNPGSEQSSNATVEYSIRIDRNGHEYRYYHSHNPHNVPSSREDATIPPTEPRLRRPSESVVIGPDRHSATAVRGWRLGRPIISQPMPGPGSPPGPLELSRPRHGNTVPPSTPYPPNALGFMASLPSGQDSLRTSQPDFASSLTSVAAGFAAIDLRDYKNCEKYMKSNLGILKVDPTVFIEEAFEALKAGKNSYAKCCIQQSLLLQDCRDGSPAYRKAYFDKFLSNSEQVRNAAEKTILKNRDKVLKKLKERLPAPLVPAAIPHGVPTEGVASLSLSGRHAVSPGGLSFSPIAPRHPQQQQQAAGRGESYRGVQEILSNAPTMSGEILDERYEVHTSTYFSYGRVFAVLWHTNIAASGRQHNQQSATNDHRSVMIREGRFGELIMSHIQRMVVVKNDHGFCWCVPVNTYNGKGVAKKGFNTKDRAAHSIIYMNDQSPYQAEDETDISQKAIKVIPAAPNQKLDRMSRLNFGKVHTVEHNVRVMPVGRIDPGDLLHFEVYWEAKAKESFRRSP